MTGSAVGQQKIVWQDEYLVASYEVDAQKKAPLPGLCKFMQESAYRHAYHLGFGYEQLKEKKQFWVLSRLSIKIHRFPRWGDRIALQTWPSGVKGLFAYRDFHIMDEEETTLAAASSGWLILDADKRRPQRPEELSKRTDLVTEQRILVGRPGKLPDLTNPKDNDLPFRVRYSDLDLYRHVNNARYIQWILDRYPLEMHQEFAVSTFEINFLSEARYGDEISIQSEEIPGAAHGFLHRIKRGEDEREICRARVNWQPFTGS